MSDEPKRIDFWLLYTCTYSYCKQLLYHSIFEHLRTKKHNIEKSLEISNEYVLIIGWYRVNPDNII